MISPAVIFAVESSTSTAARVLITGGIAIGSFLAVAVGLLVLRSLLARGGRDLPAWPAAIGGVVLAVVVVVVFQPQKLFIDDVVDDADPLATPTESSTGTMIVPMASIGPDEAMSEAMPDEGPQVIVTGTFVDRDHPTSGTAKVIQLGDGSLVLRLEDFATDNGPALQVYLSTASTDAGHGDFDDDFVHLGALKGNIGNQNYDIPAGTDLDRYTTVVIWCDPFNVAFGAAALG